MFFLNEHWGRATTTFESHSGGWWYYPAAIVAGFFPWSIFIVPVAVFIDRQFRNKHATSPAVIFLTGWVLVQVMVFTVAKTKLPSYVTPCYPALALLTGYYLDRVIANAYVPVGWLKIAGPIALGCAGLAATAGLTVIGWEYADRAWWIGFVGLIPLGAGLASIAMIIKHKPLLMVRTIAGSAILFCLALFGLASVEINQSQTTENVIDPIFNADKSVAVATYGCLESTWIFYAQRPIYEIECTEIAQAPTSLERQENWHPKPRISLQSFVTTNPGAMILTTNEYLDEVTAQLPRGYEVISEADYFLKNKTLVLIGPTKTTPHIAKQQSQSLR